MVLITGLPERSHDRRCFKPKELGQVAHFSDASGYGKGVDEAEIRDLTIAWGVGEVCHLTEFLWFEASVFIKEERTYKINDEYFWTDSKVALLHQHCYINKEEKRFKIFVANCILHIRDSSHSINGATSLLNSTQVTFLREDSKRQRKRRFGDGPL